MSVIRQILLGAALSMGLAVLAVLLRMHEEPPPGEGQLSLEEAIIVVESGSFSLAQGRDGELGIFQIKPIMVEEVNRILGEERFTLEDRKDIGKSREMFYIYSEYWAKHYNDQSLEGIARRWNGGPEGHLKSNTLPYWRKVESIILNGEAEARGASSADR